MDNIKKRAKQFLMDKVIIQDEHYLAAFLCPNIRTLKNLSETKRKEVYELVRTWSETFEKECATGKYTYL